MQQLLEAAVQHERSRLIAHHESSADRQWSTGRVSSHDSSGQGNWKERPDHRFLKLRWAVLGSRKRSANKAPTNEGKHSGPGSLALEPTAWMAEDPAPALPSPKLSRRIPAVVAAWRVSSSHKEESGQTVLPSCVNLYEKTRPPTLPP
ncbi:hypothetical protein KCU93_g55, partial [Aureobasidium melanogenum]